MKLSKIISERNVQAWPSFHIIYEWEDIIARHLDIPVTYSTDTQAAIPRQLSNRILYNRISKKILGKHNSDLSQLIDWMLYKNKELHLQFHLFNADAFSYNTSAQCIPAIIDFGKKTKLSDFYKTYKNCKKTLISSLETYHYLIDQKCPIPIAHFPLSIPDSYLDAFSTTFNKKYDIVLAGRGNAVLGGYLDRFCEEFKEVEFLYPVQENGELWYFSNKMGRVGNFQSRDSYINLIRSAKISFYSTPGMDEGAERTGGFNWVTPRFLELLAAKCLLLGRYPKNDETAFYELSRVVPNIESYDHFRDTLLKLLSTKDVPVLDYEDILSKHVTSNRATLLNQLLSNY
jgi:hypothetical protein